MGAQPPPPRTLTCQHRICIPYWPHTVCHTEYEIVNTVGRWRVYEVQVLRLQCRHIALRCLVSRDGRGNNWSWRLHLRFGKVVGGMNSLTVLYIARWLALKVVLLDLRYVALECHHTCTRVDTSARELLVVHRALLVPSRFL